jgi:hypothetical protein
MGIEPTSETWEARNKNWERLTWRHLAGQGRWRDVHGECIQVACGRPGAMHFRITGLTRSLV